MIIAALGLSGTGLAAVRFFTSTKETFKSSYSQRAMNFFFFIFISNSSVTQLRVVNKMVK